MIPWQAVRTLVVCHTRELAYQAGRLRAWFLWTLSCCRRNRRAVTFPAQIKQEFERFSKYFPVRLSEVAKPSPTSGAARGHLVHGRVKDDATFGQDV